MDKGEEMLISYHNDPKIKEKYVARIKAHKEDDRLVQGTGWDGSKGCAVGCTLENYDHKQYPIELGIPIRLARLEDTIFERLETPMAMEWPQRFLEAIPVGVDLEMIWPKFILWVLQDVIKNKYATEKTKEEIKIVIALYERWIAGNKPSDEDFLKARNYRYRGYYYYAAAAADAAAVAAAARRRFFYSRWEEVRGK